MPTSGINGFVFDFLGEEEVTFESDITDHYVEDNTAIQDQISLKPETITTHGFIGELNDVPPAALAILQAAANKLTAIGAYAPQLSATALIAYNDAFEAYQTAANVANTAISAWSSIGNAISGSDGQSVIGSSGLTGGLDGISNQNLQQTYFQQFYYYWRNRVLFTVQTPWAVFQNMAILRLRAVQDETTNTITDFEITFKMIRVASTDALLPAGTTQYGGQLDDQAQSLTNLGTQSTSSESSVSQTDANTAAGL